MPSEPGIDKLNILTLFFEAAGQSGKQRAFVNSLAREFDADSATFMIWSDQYQPQLVLVTEGAKPDDLEAAFQNRQAQDNLFSRLAAQQTGSVTRISAFPGFTACQGLAALLMGDDDKIALTLTRSAEKTPFSNDEQSQLSSLVPYLQRAIEHNRWFERARHSAEAGLFLFERAHRGILMFGAHGRVIYRNNEAKRILADGDGLSLANDQLELTDKEASLRQQLFLAGVATARGSREFVEIELESGIVIERPSGKAPYQMVLYALPLALSHANLDDKLSLVAGMIHDPEQSVGLSEQTLARFLRLTPAETNLAKTLLTEHRLKDAAESIGISINTARTQLKSIFQKLGVNSQPALMQRLTQTLDIRSTDRPKT